MRLPLITTAVLAALALPVNAVAQDETDERLDALVQMMLSADEAEIPQADFGEEDNGWFFVRENGVCRMYSFNDPLVLQADPANPGNSAMRFQMIDDAIAEQDGAEVQVLVALRDRPDAEFGAYPATAVVSQGMPPTYVVPVPMAQLAAKFPNGFHLVLADMDQKKIMQSDTLGSRKHLAALAECEQG